MLTLDSLTNIMVIKTIEKLTKKEIKEIDNNEKNYCFKLKNDQWEQLPIITVNSEMGSTIKTCLLTY